MDKTIVKDCGELECGAYKAVAQAGQRNEREACLRYHTILADFFRVWPSSCSRRVESHGTRRRRRFAAALGFVSLGMIACSPVEKNAVPFFPESASPFVSNRPSDLAWSGIIQSTENVAFSGGVLNVSPLEGPVQFENQPICVAAGLVFGSALSLPFTCSGDVPVSLYNDGSSEKELLEQFRDVILLSGGRLAVLPAGSVSIVGPNTGKSERREKGAEMEEVTTGGVEVAGQLPSAFTSRERTVEVRLDHLVSSPLSPGISPDFVRQLVQASGLTVAIGSSDGQVVAVGRDKAVANLQQVLVGFGTATVSVPTGVISPSELEALSASFPGVSFAYDDAMSNLLLTGPSGRLDSVRDHIGRNILRQADVSLSGLFMSLDDDAFSSLVVDGGFSSLDGNGFLSVGSPSVSNGVSAVLDHLQSSGRISVTARPRLTVRSGGRASYQSGEEVPAVSGVTVDEGNVTQDVVYIPTGTNIDVAASVLPDGRVRLEITMSISSVTGVGVVENPVVSRSSVTTSAFVRPGDFLLLGGLDAATDSHTSQRRFGILPTASKAKRLRRSVFLVRVAGVK